MVLGLVELIFFLLVYIFYVFFFFFFQAEDGIRDVAVTGVQTCALPISGGPRADRGTAAQGEIRRRDDVRRRRHGGRGSARNRALRAAPGLIDNNRHWRDRKSVV